MGRAVEHPRIARSARRTGWRCASPPTPPPASAELAELVRRPRSGRAGRSWSVTSAAAAARWAAGSPRACPARRPGSCTTATPSCWRSRGGRPAAHGGRRRAPSPPAPSRATSPTSTPRDLAGTSLVDRVGAAGPAHRGRGRRAGGRLRRGRVPRAADALASPAGARFFPSEPLDAVFAAAFDAHQRRTRRTGAGRLLGPDAGGRRRRRLRPARRDRATGPSPWRLGAGRTPSWSRSGCAAGSPPPATQQPDSRALRGRTTCAAGSTPARGRLRVVVGAPRRARPSPMPMSVTARSRRYDVKGLWPLVKTGRRASASSSGSSSGWARGVRRRPGVDRRRVGARRARPGTADHGGERGALVPRRARPRAAAAAGRRGVRLLPGGVPQLRAARGRARRRAPRRRLRPPDRRRRPRGAGRRARARHRPARRSSSSGWACCSAARPTLLGGTLRPGPARYRRAARRPRRARGAGALGGPRPARRPAARRAAVGAAPTPRSGVLSRSAWPALAGAVGGRRWPATSRCSSSPPGPRDRRRRSASCCRCSSSGLLAMALPLNIGGWGPREG